MGTVLIALGSLVLYILAYRTYGRHLAARVFRVDPERVSPAVEINDGVDFVPSRRDLVFGHHFTSIAGTGPIVGPAVAVVWGWVPALLWVLVGSIFVGAVHDFGSLVVSMRHRGRTIGDLAGDVVNRRVRLLFRRVLPQRGDLADRDRQEAQREPAAGVKGGKTLMPPKKTKTRWHLPKQASNSWYEHPPFIGSTSLDGVIACRIGLGDAGRRGSHLSVRRGGGDGVPRGQHGLDALPRDF